MTADAPLPPEIVHMSARLGLGGMEPGCHQRPALSDYQAQPSERETAHEPRDHESPGIIKK